MLAGGFLLILLMGEAILWVLPSKPELARKSVHFLSGGMALSFPYLIESHWTVLFLAVLFSSIIILTRKGRILRAIHDVGRRSHGALYFPIAVYVIFLLGHERPVFYFIPIMVMTVSDTLAALLGGWYGSIKYVAEESGKSLEGSAVFFFATFLCVHLSLLLMTSIDKMSSIVIALVIAMLVTGFEAISTGGSDNIFVPVGTYYILGKMTPQALAVSIEDLWKLLVMIAVTIPISLKSRLLKTSGLIGMVLLNYTAWVLCDFYWFLPLLLAQIMLYFLAAYFRRRVDTEITGHQIGVLVYSAIIPIALIFISNTINDYKVFYLPFMVSVAGQIAVISYFFVSIVEGGSKGPIAWLKSSTFIGIVVCGTASILFIAAFPLFIYSEMRMSSLGILGIGVLIAISVFHVFMVRYRLGEQRILRQKIRLVSVGAAVVATLVMEYWQRGWTRW
jgi:dolichol kinase